MLELIEKKIEFLGMEDFVTPEEIVEYLNADTYENDIYTTENILKNEYLILHEIIKVCCIKKKGVTISKMLFWNIPLWFTNVILKQLKKSWNTRRKEKIMSGYDKEWKTCFPILTIRFFQKISVTESGN